jgi:hypothetical protein
MADRPVLAPLAVPFPLLDIAVDGMRSAVIFRYSLDGRNLTDAVVRS